MYRFLAIDGALNNFGLAVGYVVDSQTIYIESIDIVSPPKRTNRKRADDAARARVIATRVRELSSKVNIVFAEQAIGSRSAAAAWSLGVALGIIASIDRPIVLVAPNEAKKIVKNYADKKEIIKWAVQKYPKLAWRKTKAGRLLNINEHAADAIAIAHAGARKLNNGTADRI